MSGRDRTISRASRTFVLIVLVLCSCAPSPSPSTPRLEEATAEVSEAGLSPTPLSPSPAPTPEAVPTARGDEPGPAANTALLRQEAREMWLGDSRGVVKAGEAVELARGEAGFYMPEGEMMSGAFPTAFPFDNAVLSWNAETPPGTRLEFQLRAGTEEGVSPWFVMGNWSAAGGGSETRQANPWGDVDVDTLELARPASLLEYRVRFFSTDPAASPRLRSVAVVYADLSRPLVGPFVEPAAGWIRDLAVPGYSQLEQDPSIARQICSPTSLAMVLSYWGVAQPVGQVAAGVRDRRARIYGNWPLNMAYAASLGFDAYVDRFHSMTELENEIAQGRPAIISIRFGPGELDGAPIDATAGHLIVVRGFTTEGDVIVNDPIAPTSESVRRVYRREQLARIWREAGGIVYVLKPR